MNQPSSSRSIGCGRTDGPPTGAGGAVGVVGAGGVGMNGGGNADASDGPPASPAAPRPATPWCAALHQPAPDFDRQAAAGRLLGGRGVVVAEPDTGDEVSGVADEPGVTEILARASLAGGRPARPIAPSEAVPIVKSLAHHRVHHGDVARPRDTVPNLFGGAHVQGLAGAGAHALDHVRRDGVAAVGERRIGGDELDQRHLGGAERQRGIGLELRRNAQPIGGLGGRDRPELLAQPHRHGVERHGRRWVSVTGP